MRQSLSLCVFLNVSLFAAVVEQLWPSVSAMFFPWIAPYWTDQLSEPTAAWIQQLTDDRSVLPPWIVGDASFAQRIMGTFVEVMRFILDTLPGEVFFSPFLWGEGQGVI